MRLSSVSPAATTASSDRRLPLMDRERLNQLAAPGAGEHAASLPPLPWSLAGSQGARFIAAADGRIVVNGRECSDETLMRIVHCVNTYGALLRPLVTVRDSFIYTDDHSDTAVDPEAGSHGFEQVCAAVVAGYGLPAAPAVDAPPGPLFVRERTAG